jgi:hypothetical protein
MRSFVVSIIAASAAIIGCSQSTSPSKVAPHASREFDPRLPNVQITQIYYDENANESVDGTANEYIVLQARDSANISHWTIKAGGHDYFTLGTLTLHQMFTLYTRYQDGLPTANASSMNLLKWVWHDHDTAFLVNDHGAVVSELAY